MVFSSCACFNNSTFRVRGLLRRFRHVRKDEKMEIKKVFELRIDGGRKSGMPVKRWIDMVEKDVRGVVRQDAGDMEGWRRTEVKGLANPS